MRIVLRQTPLYFPICAVSHGETTHIATPNGPYRRLEHPASRVVFGQKARFSVAFRQIFRCTSLHSFPITPGSPMTLRQLALHTPYGVICLPGGSSPRERDSRRAFVCRCLRFLTFVYGMRCAVVVCPPDFHTAGDGCRGVPRVCSFASCSYKLRRKKRAYSFAFRLICTNFAL